MINAPALYYPYISVPDDSWLRTSLLLWEQISSIVPASAPPPRQHISHKLRQAGLVHFVDPSDYWQEINAGRFYNGFKKLLRNREINTYLSSETEWTQASLGLDDVTNVIHETKLSHQIMNYLIAEHGAERHEDWIECDSRICDIYMAYLTAHIRDVLGANPVTNIRALDDLLDTVEKSRTPPFVREQMASVVSDIEGVVPELPPDYPIQKIIELRQRHSRAYERFRRAFVKLRSGLNRVQDEEEAEELAVSFKWDLEDSFSELSDSARESRLDVVHATVRTVFSVTGATAALLVATDPTKMVVSSAAGVVLAYKFGEELRRIRLDKEVAIRNNDFGYLFLLNRDVR